MPTHNQSGVLEGLRLEQTEGSSAGVGSSCHGKEVASRWRWDRGCCWVSRAGGRKGEQRPKSGPRGLTGEENGVGWWLAWNAGLQP